MEKVTDTFSCQIKIWNWEKVRVSIINGFLLIIHYFVFSLISDNLFCPKNVDQKAEVAAVLAYVAKALTEIRCPSRKVLHQHLSPRRNERTLYHPILPISRNVVALPRHKSKRRVELIDLDRILDLAQKVLVELEREDVLDLAVDPSVVGTYSYILSIFHSSTCIFWCHF